MRNSHIVVIEDNQIQADYILSLISGETYTTNHFTAVTPALEYLKNTAPNYSIIILDHHLPDFTGLEVLEQIQKINKKFAAIYLTVNNQLQVAIEAMKLGAFDYAVKSNEIGQFLPILIRKANEHLNALVERDEANVQLNQQINLFRSSFEDSAIGRIIASADGKIKMVNTAFANMLCFRPEELIGKTIASITYEFDFPDCKNIWLELLKNKIRRATHENRFLRKDNQPIWVETSIVLVRDKKDNPVHFVLDVVNIDENKQNLEKLDNARQVFTRFFHQSPIPSALTRAKDLIIVDVNEQLLQLTGFKREQLINHSHTEYIENVDADFLRRIIEVVKQRNSLRNVEFTFSDKHGNKKHALAFVELLHIEDETYISTQLFDITEQKKLLQTIKESEEKYRQIFENIQDVYYETTMDGTILEVSPSIATASKGMYKREELIGKNLSEFYANPKQRKEFLATITQHGYVQNYEIQLKNKDGSVEDCLVTAKIAHNKETQEIKIIGNYKTITQKKQLEQQIKASEKLYRLITNKITDVVWLMDLQGKSLFVTPSIENFTGFTVEEYLQQSIPERFTPQSANYGLQIFAAELQQYQHNPNLLQNYSKRLEMEYICKNGSTKWGELIISPYFDENNNLIGIHGVTRDITDKKKAQQQLLESEKMFRSIAENAFDFIAIIDLLGRYTYCNPTYKKLLGYEPESLLGKTCFDLLHPDDKEIVTKALFAGIANESKFGNISARVLTHDGNICWVDHFARPIYNEGNNSFQRILIIGRDITEQKKAEEIANFKQQSLMAINNIAFALTAPLQRNELYAVTCKELKKLCHALGVTFALYNKADKTLDIKHLEIDSMIFNKTRELLGLDITKIRSKVSDEQYKQILNEVVAEKNSMYDVTFGEVSKVASALLEKTLGVDRYMGMAFVYNNELLGTAVIAFRKQSLIPDKDMLNSVASLISLALIRKEAEEKQWESEKQYRELIYSMGEGVGIVNTEEVFEFANPAAEKIFELNQDTLVGRCLLDFVDEKGKTIVKQETLKRQLGTLGNYELDIFTALGNKKTLLISSSPKFDNKGKLIGIFGIFRDITELKNNQELQKELEIAKKTSQLKQQFLANMSHEIRTPLNGIVGVADMLLSTNLDQTQLDYAQTIQVSSQQLLHIVNDILDFSKIEAGKMRVVNEMFSLNSLKSKLKNYYDSLKKNKPLQLTISSDSKLPEYILSDEKRIFQIASNLLSNAIKFTPEGEIKIHFSLAEKQDKNILVKVAVSDTGIGISEEDKEKVFSIFTQIDSSYTRKYEGTGLGLTISKQLVELLDGTIGLESQLGKGSTFWFTFKAELTQIKHAPISKTETNREPIKAHILLVEDMYLNRKVIELMLKKIGCTVDMATNGMEALQIFQPNKYDIIFMDIQMPQMDGVEVVKQLKAKFEKLPPIIGLSANALEGDAERYMNEGMDDYLSKPVTDKQLYEKLKKWFKKK